MPNDLARLHDLESDGVLSPADAGHAAEVLRRTREPLDHILTQLGLISETALAERFARTHGLDVWVDGLGAGFEQLPASLNPDFIRRERVLPVAREGQAVRAVIVDPGNRTGLEGLAFALDEAVLPSVVTASRFSQLLEQALGGEAQTAGGAAKRDAIDVSADTDRLRDIASAEPIIRLVNSTIASAVEAGASDIHIEPGSRDAEVRLRIDGVLRPRERLALPQALAFISRVKVLADLDISERRRPQDGRISIPVAGRSVDLRVSVVPSQHGESLVVRLLDPDASLRDLDHLGFSSQVLDVARTAIAKPHGLVLVTGPTGSGKTTTLYAFLRQLADGHRKILTIEDPIEYRLPGIAQSQTNAAIGVTFASALRSFLRHDPDVVMVGEIRDAETARTAIQAAMTGHLVLSTIHTNDAPSAVVRLMDMGVEDYLVASTLSAVFAQRLVRRVCSACAGSGCDTCGGEGYRGRLAIAEGFAVDDSVRQSIQTGLNEAVLRAGLAAQGYRPMLQEGRDRIASGDTTEAEVRRTVGWSSS